MTRVEALKTLERLYGKGKAYYRVLNLVTSPEMRAESLHELRDLRAKRDALDAVVQAWLNAQPFYQQKTQERKQLSTAIRAVESRGLMHAFRFTIGRSIGWANEITGQGDTWEQAFGDAIAKEKPKAVAS